MGAPAFFPQSPDSLRCRAPFYFSCYYLSQTPLTTDPHPPLQKTIDVGKECCSGSSCGAAEGCGRAGGTWPLHSVLLSLMLAGGGYRWMRDWPNKERSFTNIHVTSLMLFIHFHIVLQSNAKQCRDSIISHSKAWITSGFCKRVLMKTLLCVHSWCIRVRRALLSASGRLISLIAARRRPSTRRPRGIATETQSNENYYTRYLKNFWK